MSYIDITRRGLGSAYENTVCMTEADCEVLLPYLARIQREIKLKYDKYLDVRDGGEATERDLNLLMKYTERLEHMGSLLYNVNELIGKPEKNKNN